MKKRLLSGMRPTGRLHLGHLVGALENWVKLQSEYECLFMIADWHALMSEYRNPKTIRNFIFDNFVDFLSVGIDPKESIIFLQSEVKEHLELNMILSCITPLGWLMRCPTYKEQMRELKDRELSTYGFLGYPVLQASDILLYKAEFVPVGADQLPHLELAREIVRRFNQFYKPILIEPKPLLTETPRLLGIDGRKMSKSYQNTIDLSDSPSVIRKKVESMFTDPKRIRFSDPGNPSSCNVFSYFSTFKSEMKEKVRDWCTNARKGCRECKSILSEVIIQKLSPIQLRRRELLKDKEKLSKILKEENKKAGDLASQTIKEIKKAVCLG
jgi:tryptophanyl-tRNA synthetase